VLEGLRGEDSIAELCRKEGFLQSPSARLIDQEIIELFSLLDRSDELAHAISVLVKCWNSAVLRIVA
jgi:hypothetical protein